MRYRRKPEYVDAIKWTGENYSEIKEFAEDNIHSYGGCIFLHTSGIRGSIDSAVVNQGDYIVKGENGHFYSLDDKAFNTIYEPDEKKKTKQNKEV